jgi:pilus assembly protein FimV
MTQAKHTASRLFQRSALCAALSLSLLGGAQALTLTRPVVQSKQGEALRAEIDISEISYSEQVDFQASVASQEIYKAAKVELPLSNGSPLEIQVQLLRRDNGTPYLKISSKQVVTSNAMDLLIDLRWATGRLLRDFSLSLDDPKKAPKPIVVPTLAAGTNTDKNGQQILVKRGDTASELTVNQIAEDVSLDQMLLALLRSNPDAFVESNVNRMKEGALLTLPTAQEAKAVSREEARREIQVQTKDFDAYRAELAARAPGGVVPKAARDTTGKLDAKVQNKNNKANQDKLTLAKPSSQDVAAQDKIAQQREAQDVATRAAELSRNIAELSKIAAATVTGTVASEPASGVLPVNVPADAESANSEWLNELREHPLTPAGAGSLIALLVMVGLWRRRALSKNEAHIQGLPPLNVKFNLDLPEFDHAPADLRHTHEASPQAEDELVEEHANHAEQPPRPTMEMPNISLELDDADHASPYRVRMDLADELWNLGQLHTSRALMEEVSIEASGTDKEIALKWLADRG